MSYNIFYRAMFIKTRDNKFIPMAETGCSNVWDCDRRRRSRSWDALRWSFEGKEQLDRYALTAEELLATAQQEIDQRLKDNEGRHPSYEKEPYTRERILNDFGYFSSIHISGHATTTANHFLNFYKAGLRNAISIEEMADKGITLRLGWYAKDEGQESSTYHREDFADEQAMADRWDELRGQGITVYLGLSEWCGNYCWNIVKERNRKPARGPKKPATEAFVISFRHIYLGTRYLSKLTARHLWHNDSEREAHKYSTRKSAEHAAGKLQGRFEGLSDIKIHQLKLA